MGSQRFWGFEGRKNRDQGSENRGKGGAMELARARVRVALCRTILACETPLKGLCAKRGELTASMVWVEVVGFKQVSQSQSGEGLAFFGWSMGDRVAGLPEGTFSGSIDFQMRLAWEVHPSFAPIFNLPVYSLPYAFHTLVSSLCRLPLLHHARRASPDIQARHHAR